MRRKKREREKRGKKLTERNKEKFCLARTSRVAHARFSREIAKFNRAVVPVYENKARYWIQVACCRLLRAGRETNIERHLIAAKWMYSNMYRKPKDA